MKLKEEKEHKKDVKPGSDSSVSNSGPLLMLAESSECALTELRRPRSCSISLSLLSRAICSSTRITDSSVSCWEENKITDRHRGDYLTAITE